MATQLNTELACHSYICLPVCLLCLLCVCACVCACLRACVRTSSWQSIDAFGDPLASSHLASVMAGHADRSFRFNDVLKSTQNFLAMQLCAAPIDHRLAKFTLAWSIM